MLQMLPSGEVHIVDSDEQVEQHNLNRQVLYNEQHIGLAKAIVAQERLSRINPNLHIHGYVEHLLPGHINQELLNDEEELEATILMIALNLNSLLRFNRPVCISPVSTI